MPFAKIPQERALAAIEGVKTVPFWLDDDSRPDPCPALREATQADLAIVGAGFTGLWTALLAKEENPDLNVVLLDGGRAAGGATGRNGGFMHASLTHGFENGLARWGDELRALTRMGNENLSAIEAAIRRYRIHCDYQPSGELIVATEPYMLEEMQRTVEQAEAYGEHLRYLDRNETRGMVNSPTYLGGMFIPNVAMVNPAQLAWGIRRACLDLGLRLFEDSQVVSLEQEADGIVLETQHGRVLAKKVALATNAYPPLLKRISLYVVPVYDYALMTEPLTAEQRAGIGWERRVGVADAGNQFHYYRMTADGRILWGGYDAVYYRNNGFGEKYESNPRVFARLAEHFFETFPQLEGLRFTHGWGGAIDTCSRFSVFWGKAFGGRLVYSLGFTGLGVGASRFGALTMLDLLHGRRTERTALQMVRAKPVPFPPEPLRSPIITLTERSLARADRDNGRRNLWLQFLDALGLGFDT